MFFEDISELKQREKELEEAKRLAEEASQAKSDFLRVLSHELRTPLNPILGFSALLADRMSDKEDLDLVAHIERSASHMLEMVTDLLQFIEISPSSIQQEYRAVRPLSLIRESFSFFEKRSSNRFAIRNGGWNHFREIPEDFQCSLAEDHFRRVLNNLLKNADKFTSDGKIRLSCGLRTGNGRTVLRVMVEDSGIGIPESDQARIFEPFVQVDSSVTRAYEGLGIGLSTSRRLINAMGGKIRVSSKMGEGTCFCVDLPLDAAEFQEISGFLDKSGRPEVPLPTRYTNILLVEDDDDNCRLIEHFCESWGVRVRTVRDGWGGLRAWEEDPNCLVLLDISLPGMDGITVLKEIRETEKSRKLPRTPVIAVTAHIDRKTSETCREAGVDAFVAKPIDRRFLEGTIANWIELSGRLATPSNSP